MGWVTFGEYMTGKRASFSFVTIHASDRWKNRQTDGQIDKIVTQIQCIALHAAW